MTKSGELIRDFVNGFQKIYREDKREGYTVVLSTFISCYSQLTIEHREKSLATLMLLIERVGSEIFEDGEDFLCCLKEKFYNEEEANDL